MILAKPESTGLQKRYFNAWRVHKKDSEEAPEEKDEEKVVETKPQPEENVTQPHACTVTINDFI